LHAAPSATRATKTRGSPRHPTLTESQFCGHATGVNPHREDAGPIFLVPEGRLYRFGLTQVRANPPGERQRDEHDPSYRKYGFEASVMGPFREGAPITLAQKRAA
jgi:hypothetical protein